ncbi:MAG: hypothetical protein ABIR15_14970 [Chitinophagaceae bacterium]
MGFINIFIPDNSLYGMTTAEKLSFKNSLKQFCQQHIEQRVAAAKEAIKNAQDSANNEEKSSAGDKYETGRAMGHLQKDMHARQLSEYIKEISELHAVNTGIIYNQAIAGAFIETDQSSFFIAAGLGKQIIKDRQILFLSPHAPLATILQNKKQGDSFVFNGAMTIIKNVF